MPPFLIAMSAAAVLSALTGGVMALRLVRQVGYVIAIGAGIRIGAAFFDLLPESVELMGGRTSLAMAFAAIGFLAPAGCRSTASSIGVALAAAFQASPELGFVVGLVVVIHRFSDSVVSLLLANRVPRQAGHALGVPRQPGPRAGSRGHRVLRHPRPGPGALLATFAGFFLDCWASRRRQDGP